jgi:hypothetical protein
MQGFYTVYSSHTSRPPFARPQQDQESLAWASTLSAEMPSQLAFALEPPKYSGPQGVAAFGRFSRAVEAFKDLIVPSLTGPRVRVARVNGTVISGARSGSPAPILSKVYVQQESVGSFATNRSWCAVVVVINGAHAPAKFTVSLAAAEVPDYIQTAFTMLPFASYAISLHNGSTATVDLQDVIPANGVAHYRLSLDARGNELGCPEIQ